MLGVISYTATNNQYSAGIGTHSQCHSLHEKVCLSLFFDLSFHQKAGSMKVGALRLLLTVAMEASNKRVLGRGRAKRPQPQREEA